jgi:hypothetical protein
VENQKKLRIDNTIKNKVVTAALPTSRFMLKLQKRSQYGIGERKDGSMEQNRKPRRKVPQAQ